MLVLYTIILVLIIAFMPWIIAAAFYVGSYLAEWIISAVESYGEGWKSFIKAIFSRGDE